MILVYWVVCLPILRKIGTVPIVRIEGGSSSGKTRTVDAVSFLVNGGKSSSVPTAPALISRLSTEMLTVDDNRESRDVTSDFQGTLLQATHLGARSKRKFGSDTGTIVERVCGALLMNGIEPIHDGRSELASRILTLRCSDVHRVPDSPRAEASLAHAILGARDGFWSESARRCAAALALDAEHGEHLGAQIEEIFGATRIGRLSAFLRMMYLAWVAGLKPEHHAETLVEVSPVWRDAFSAMGEHALESLLAEELAVSVVRYVFAWGAMTAEPKHTGSDEYQGLERKFAMDKAKGEAFLGPVRAQQLARFARAAGKELNAPPAITRELRAGQLERRLLDGIAFLEAAGFGVEVEVTAKGRSRFTFARTSLPQQPTQGYDSGAGETWTGPGV